VWSIGGEDCWADYQQNLLIQELTPEGNIIQGKSLLRKNLYPVAALTSKSTKAVGRHHESFTLRKSSWIIDGVARALNFQRCLDNLMVSWSCHGGTGDQISLGADRLLPISSKSLSVWVI